MTSSSEIKRKVEMHKLRFNITYVSLSQVLFTINVGAIACTIYAPYHAYVG